MFTFFRNRYRVGDEVLLQRGEHAGRAGIIAVVEREHGTRCVVAFDACCRTTVPAAACWRMSHGVA